MDTNAKTDVSYYLELKQELTELRAWKEKARPFLYKERQLYEEVLGNLTKEDATFMGTVKERIAILTELLGGSDEN